MVKSNEPCKGKLTPAPELPRSVAAIAAQYLEREIIEGRLAPGQRLIEEAWAEQFGISRGSFREVLRILEAAKLVEILPRRGAQVASLNRRDVEEIYLLRKNLFKLGYGHAASNMTDESMEALWAIYAEMERAVERDDTSEFSKLSQTFDGVVLDVAGISRLELVIGFLGKQTVRYRHIGFKLPGRIKQSLGAHKRILEAFSQKDGEKAGQTVYEVIEQAGESILSQAFSDSQESSENWPATAAPGAANHSEA